MAVSRLTQRDGGGWREKSMDRTWTGEGWKRQRGRRAFPSGSMSSFVSLFSAIYFISSKHLCHSKQANDTTCYLLDFADQKQSVQSKLESSLWIYDSGCQWLSSTMQCELGGCTTTRKCTCTNTHTCTVWVHAQTLKPHNCLHMNKTHCSSALLKGSRSAMKHAYASLLQDEMTVLLLCVGVCVCNSRKLCQTWQCEKQKEWLTEAWIC